MTNIHAVISDIQSQLETVYPKDEAGALAWWIMEEETGLSRSQILTGCKITKNFAHVQEVIARLLHFEPIQYIYGHTEWCGLDLRVTPATLIPRPETAELVERINRPTQTLPKGKALKVLDIGTGSGCIAIALKKAHPEWEVTGIDISEEAIEVARENAKRNKVDVDFRVADIFSDENGVIEPLGGEENGKNLRYDIVVSNPPYICEKEKAGMRRNVLDFEPSGALFVPDDDPLKFYRRIAELFSLPLQGKDRERGFLFFEINEAYGDEIVALLNDYGYRDIRLIKDMYGKARIVEGRMVG